MYSRPCFMGTKLYSQILPWKDSFSPLNCTRITAFYESRGRRKSWIELEDRCYWTLSKNEKYSTWVTWWKRPLGTRSSEWFWRTKSLKKGPQAVHKTSGWRISGDTSAARSWNCSDQLYQRSSWQGGSSTSMRGSGWRRRYKHYFLFYHRIRLSLLLLTLYRHFQKIFR